MKKIEHVSDELINSFIDDQLSADEKNQLLEAINADPELGAQVCDAQRLKVLVSHAYQRTPHSAQQGSRGASALLKYRHAMAAGLILVVGTFSGWFAHNWWDPLGLQSGRQQVYYLQPEQLAAKWSGQQKVVLHVGSSEPGKLKASLDQAEYLLNRYHHAGRQIQMELVVSGGGLDLLRADVSPYAERIKSMKATYGTLSFIACRQTIDRLQKGGVEVRLLPETTQLPTSALDEVVTRLQQGWTYVSI